MRKLEWNEEHIEQLLQQIPTIKDERSKEAVYREVASRIKKQRLTARVIPSIASIVAVLLAVMLGLPLLFKRHEEYSLQSKQDQAIENAQEKAATLQEEEKQQVNVPSRIVTKEQLQNRDVVVFGIPDANAQNVIPVSVLVAKDGESYIQHLEKERAVLSEEEWGLSKNLLNGVTMAPSSDNAEKWIVDVSKDHPVFTSGSSGEEMFLASIEETLRWVGVNKIEFFTDGKKGITLPNTGPLETFTVPLKKRAYFLYNLDENHPVFLTPSSSSLKSFQVALEQMKRSMENPLRPSIPKEVRVASIRANRDEATVRFSDDSKLDDSPETVWMLEAILLTAKEFGFKSVTFAGGKAERVGSYTFNEKIDVPVAPNPMPME